MASECAIIIFFSAFLFAFGQATRKMSVRAANVDFFFLIHLSFVVDRPLCDVCADS